VNLQLGVPVSCRGRVPGAAARQPDCECIRGCGCGDVEQKDRIGRAVPLSICVFEDAPSLDRVRIARTPVHSRMDAERMRKVRTETPRSWSTVDYAPSRRSKARFSLARACHLKSNRFSSVSLALFPALFFVAILSRGRSHSLSATTGSPASPYVCRSLLMSHDQSGLASLRGRSVRRGAIDHDLS